jgi:hypothetical protein
MPHWVVLAQCLVDTNRRPSTSDRVQLGSVAREERLGGDGHGRARGGKVAGRRQVVDQRVVDNVECRQDANGADVVGGLLLRMRSALNEQNEEQVADAAVPVHTTVIENADVAVGIVIARGTIQHRVVPDVTTEQRERERESNSASVQEQTTISCVRHSATYM